MHKTEVILVNDADEAIGTMEKIEAHKKALLHRAFSVFIFNSKGEMLLHQRSFGKYHSAGLWTNACCSHPLPGEEIRSAAERRLKEEMGFITGLEEIFSFIYKVELGDLTEHEFDHVFAGIYDGNICHNTEEVLQHQYLSIEKIEKWLANQPEDFTVWFKLAFPTVKGWWLKRFIGPDRIA